LRVRELRGDGPADRRQRTGRVRATRRWRLKKNPPFATGASLGRKSHCKSIRRSVVCRNSHTHRKKLVETALRSVSVEPLSAAVDLLVEACGPPSASPLESPASPRRGFRFCRRQLSPKRPTSGRRAPARSRWCDQITTPAENHLHPYSEHSCAHRHAHDLGKLLAD
jgi:hypothetical protein